MKSGTTKRSMHLPRPLKIFLFVNVVLGFLALAALSIICFRFHARADQLYTYFLPLGTPVWFQDFKVFLLRFHYFHSPAFFSMGPQMGGEPPFEYPAPAALLYRFFYAFPFHPAVSFVTFIIGTIISLALFLGKQMTHRGVSPAISYSFVAISVLFSYPFWLEFALANMEFCIFIFVGAGVVAFCLDRPYVAAIAFGIAAGMKIFPFVFVALFLSRKQYKPILLAAVVCVLLNLVGLWAIDPSIKEAYNGINAGLQVNRQHYMLHVLQAETGIDHSLFGFFKRLAYERDVLVIPSRLLTTYIAITATGGLLLYFGRIRKLPLINQIVSLYIVAVLLPPTSHDYTLIHLYVPWAMLVLYALDRVNAGRSVKDLLPVFILFAIIFSPENEAIHRHMGFSGQIKCLAILALFLIALTRKWETPKMMDQHGVIPEQLVRWTAS